MRLKFMPELLSLILTTFSEFIYQTDFDWIQIKINII